MTKAILEALDTEMKQRSAKRAAKRPAGALSFSRGAWDDGAEPRCKELGFRPNVYALQPNVLLVGTSCHVYGRHGFGRGVWDDLQVLVWGQSRVRILVLADLAKLACTCLPPCSPAHKANTNAPSDDWLAQAFGARSAAMLADVTNRGAAEGTPARTPAPGKPAAAPHRTPASAAFANRPQARHVLCLPGASQLLRWWRCTTPLS